MRVFVVATLFVCGALGLVGCKMGTGAAPVGGSSADAPAAAPGGDETAEAPADKASASVGVFADQAAVLAAVEGEREPIINELSGEEVGQSITRAAPGAVGGVPCGTVVQAYAESWGCETTENFTQGGHTLTPGWVGLHYKAGSLTNIVAERLVPKQEALTLGGVPCATWAGLHADGSLESCALREAHSFGTVNLPKETEVTLRGDGTVASAVIYAEDFAHQGKAMEAGTFEFSADGSVAGHNAGWFGD